MHTASQWQHDEGGHAVAGSHRQHVAGVPQAVEAQRTAMAGMCHVAEALCETSERLRGAVTAEPSEAISARLERLEERMGRLEERVSLIEAQWLKAAEALRHAATGTP